MKTFDHRSGQVLSIIDGASIYVETSGSDAGTPLLLLHGGFGTMEDFKAIVPHVDPGYRLIAVDSRGHGKSTLGNEPLTYARLQADLEAVVEHFALKSFHLIGFSDGGVVALRIAAAGHAELKKLVVIGTPYELRPDDPSRQLLAKVTGESWRNKFPETWEAYQALNPAPDFDTLARAVVSMWLDTSESGYPGSTIEHIRCPLLVARGDDDHLTTRSGAFGLAEKVPGAELLSVPFAGHELHKEKTGMVMAIVNDFLQAR